jgi:Na+-translocating ferredoxin:NAD+ oxidoreductase RnfC subunit
MAGDLDRAIETGLLEVVPCNGCSDECTALLVAARDARLRALAARERYRARQARLQRRAAERAAARATPASAATVTTHQPKLALPSAAAAALERAKARAAERRKP